VKGPRLNESTVSYERSSGFRPLPRNRLCWRYILFDSIRLLRQAVFPKFGNLFCKVYNVLKCIYVITVLGFTLYTYF